MPIGEMSATYDVTPRALRFYESKGLLSPVRQGQSRLYTRRDQARLKLVLRGRRFVFSLDSIRQLLDLYELDARHEAQLARSCDMARRRIAEMEQQRAELDETITELKAELARGEARLAGLRTGAPPPARSKA